MSDYDAMLDLAGKFGNLSIDGLGEALIPVVDQLVKYGFDNLVDPYGQPWPPNRVNPNPFDPHHAIRESVAVGYGSHEIIVNFGHPAASFQFEGTYGKGNPDGVAPKIMAPVDDRLGNWEPPLLEAYYTYFDNQLGGAGKSPKSKRR